MPGRAPPLRPTQPLPCTRRGPAGAFSSEAGCRSFSLGKSARSAAAEQRPCCHRDSDISLSSSLHSASPGGQVRNFGKRVKNDGLHDPGRRLMPIRIREGKLQGGNSKLTHFYASNTPHALAFPFFCPFCGSLGAKPCILSGRDRAALWALPRCRSTGSARLSPSSGRCGVRCGVRCCHGGRCTVPGAGKPGGGRRAPGM